MRGTSPLRSWAADSLPAAIVVAGTSVMLERSVPELDGRLPELVLAGLGGSALTGLCVAALLRRVSVTIPTSDAPPSWPAPPSPELALDRLQGTSATGAEGLSLPKEGATDDENEDSWRMDTDRGLFIVSDGASSSFGARVWSSALAQAAIDDPRGLDAEFVERVVERAAEEWTSYHSTGEVAWWAQEGLRRGAFATLMALRVGTSKSGRVWQALAVGDSCVLHLRQVAGVWSLMCSFPVDSAAGFGSHPDLLSSVNRPVSTPTAASGDLEPGDILVIATDAVSEWLLSDTSRLTAAATAPLAALGDMCVAARRDRTMVNDDVTLLRYVEPGSPTD